MRTFYQEMKKSISEALEKKRMKQQHGIGEEGKHEIPHLIDDEPTQIDTTSNQAPQLHASISSEETERLERDIQIIVQRIIEKSEFLLKLATPEIWE